ncbi:DNA adenine methylase [Pantoea sp. LMR881]|nr:DNA adenine methylase [Pantoea sp. LMR881]MCZ4061158.1 DNA adenine methylase [Pantoea sp. LMR881]
MGDTISHAGAGDVIFCDPPYQPMPKTEGFTSYATGKFTMADQESLVLHLKAACERGAKAVITNSSSALIIELYKDHGLTINPLRARRNISSKTSTQAYADDIIALF